MRDAKIQLLHQLSLLLLLLCVFNALANAITPAVSIAQPGCTDRCGNVKIPYPFGIGSGCYQNRSFEIICNKPSHPYVPFLKILDREVMQIDISGGPSGVKTSQIRIKAGQIFTNDGKKRLFSFLNLTGLPFYYANRNRIVGVGCDTWVRSSVVGSSSNYLSAGCLSTCIDSKYMGELGNRSLCNGIKCCSFTKTFEDILTIKLMRSEHSASKINQIAFLSDEVWSPFNATEEYIRKKNHMPITLSWYASPRSGYQSPVSFSCENTTFRAENLTTCWCEKGFRGNPYLPDGCKDIDECRESKSEGQNLCGKDDCVNTPGSYECHVKDTRPIVLGTCLGFGVLLLAVGAWWVRKYMKRWKAIKQRKMNFKRNGGLLMQQQLYSVKDNVGTVKIFSSKELKKATDNFNEGRILGYGGQGVVYKGMLGNGTIVAIKKAKQVAEENLEAFINEIIILSKINHRNVVQLLGCCLEIEVPTLVYEFVAGGSLFEHLHFRPGGNFLEWNARLRIATEIANALCHLHFSTTAPIYHRDIKSNNVLLDEKYRAKVSDFGLSRVISIDQTHLTTAVMGTPGYMDPEYLGSGHFTEKSDVFSFGVLLIELLTGEKPINATRSEEKRNLVTYFFHSMKENRLFEVVDPKILENSYSEEILDVANLAIWCLNPKCKARPTMKEAAMKLESILPPQQTPCLPNEKNESIGEVQVESMRATTFSITTGNSSSVSLSDTEPLTPYSTWE